MNFLGFYCTCQGNKLVTHHCEGEYLPDNSFGKVGRLPIARIEVDIPRRVVAGEGDGGE